MRYKVKTDSLRKILDYPKGKIYSIVLPVNELPDFEDWMNINPRGQNLNSALSSDIFESLVSEPLFFVLKNRGLTLMAQGVRYDNRSQVLSFTLDDRDKHGLLDGGHTYKIARKYVGYIKGKEENIYDMPMVRIEIIESDDIDDSDRVGIVKARNSSTQVKDTSLANLKNYFDKIKEEIEGKEYDGLISYKENDIDGENKKPIPVSDILSYLKCFDQNFKREEQPIVAYSGKGGILKKFANEEGERERTEKLIPLLKDILVLRDTIYLSLPDWYNGSFGHLAGVICTESRARGARRRKATELHFIGEKSKYRIPAGFIYPFLAAFRANLDENAQWKADPQGLLNRVGKRLANIVGQRALELKNPNQLGKDKSVWQLCYQEVLLSVSERDDYDQEIDTPSGSNKKGQGAGPRFDFAAYGIPVGTKISSCDAPSIKAKVLENGYIEFDGKKTSLTAAAKKVRKKLGLNISITGVRHWMHKGKKLEEYKQTDG